MKGLVNYDTNAYGTPCGHTRSAVAGINVRALLAICAKNEKYFSKLYCVVAVSLVKSVNSNMSS